jgi:preprotein translocase subunit SecE
VARDRKRAKRRTGRRGSGLPPSKPIRSNLPGSLQHASGEADQFDAALLRGVEGVPADTQEQEAESQPSAAQAQTPAPTGQRGSLLVRTVEFLRASWAELQRVQWPDRRYVFQATAVVIGFVAVAGVYLGVADWVAQKIVNLLL